MARVKNGILGGFSGKVGSVIGQNYAGVSTMRAMPKYVTNPRTPSQISHREEFSKLAKLLSGAMSILRYCNENKNSVYNGFNSALSYNWKNARDNNGIVLQDLTFGTFWGGEFDGLVFTLTNTGNILQIDAKWDVVENDYNKFLDDQLLLIAVYTPANNDPFVIASGSFPDDRREGGSQLQIILDAPLPVGDRVDVFAGVNSYETWKAYGHNPRKPKEIINIPARKGLPASQSSAKDTYYKNRPHWFTNIVGE